MPILNDNMTSQAIGGGFTFSHVKMDKLGSDRYTLVLIACDTSGSVSPFRDSMEGCVKAIIEGCQKNPFRDSLLVRYLTFNSTVKEAHGFRPLVDCATDSYTGTITCGGLTALNDAVFDGVASIKTFGQNLQGQDFDVNAILVVITDGYDNCSQMTPTEIQKTLKGAVTEEAVESLMSILIGVNTDGGHFLSSTLDAFRQAAGIDRYEEIASVDPGSFAKLADFISRSISGQSQALGTGGVSQSLTF